MTRYLSPIEESRLSEPLQRLQSRIERSSNFRFAWQLFQYEGFDSRSAEGAELILREMIARGSCHEFLRDTFDPMYEPSFEIRIPHEHSAMVDPKGGFEEILASAAGDHLGAYSRVLRDATPREAAEVESIFRLLGDYHAFQLQPGRQPDCEACASHDSHLFSSWFYGVAWDWCFLLTWPDSSRAWIGCLTDTD